jgi:signal transduction histidine kinase
MHLRATCRLRPWGTLTAWWEINLFSYGEVCRGEGGERQWREMDLLPQLVNAGSLWVKVSIVATLLCSLWAFYLIRFRRLVREMDLRFEVQMEERMRIARELHDTLLQSLQGLVLSLSHLTARVKADSDVREEMEYALERDLRCPKTDR